MTVIPMSMCLTMPDENKSRVPLEDGVFGCCPERDATLGWFRAEEAVADMLVAGLRRNSGLRRPGDDSGAGPG